MSIHEYFGDWCKVINIEEADRILKSLIDSGKPICPLPRDVYKAFRECPYDNLKVVMLAQDPYPDYYKGKPRATGIAFANAKDTPYKDCSPSLKVLRESVIDFTKPHGIVTFDNSLEKWEKQGVLMLNTALTCERGKIGVHSLIWRKLIGDMLMGLSKINPGIVYVLMGSAAKSFKHYINRKNNFILECVHPSWYARTEIPMPPNIWRDINTILLGLNGSTIEWFEEE